MVSGHLQLHTLSGNSGLSKFKHGIVRLVERRGAPRDAWFIHLKQKKTKNVMLEKDSLPKDEFFTSMR